MHQLLLLRHAKASRDDPRVADRDRPLNDTGRRQAKAMRRLMQNLGLAPDLVLVSPSRRTLQTLELLEPWDETPLTEPLEDLYLAEEARILDVLRNVTETVRGVLLIGHNPGLRELAQTLSGSGNNSRIDAFPTCALAEFMVRGAWSDLPVGARLIRILDPRRDLK
jgi:phosphohistidine phosphatase